MLEIRRLTKDDSLEIDIVNELYDSAFPPYEKRSFKGRQAVMACDNYYLMYFTEDNQFVGFLDCWKMENTYYVEYLAVSARSRGKGYGQKILNKFCTDAKKVILEIDPLFDDVSRKRLSFYQHCGFNQNAFSHVHPNYHPEFTPHQLIVLSYPERISDEEYQQFNQQLKSVVMEPSLL